MNRGQTCTYYSLETKGRTNDHISQVSVTSTTNGGIALRYVNEDGDAAVLKYGSTDNSHKYLSVFIAFSNMFTLFNLH